MAFFTLLWKARTIEKYRLNYEREKLNSIRIMNAQNPKKTLYQRWCHYNVNTKKKISKTFLRYYPEGSRVHNFIYYLKTDQTFPNFLLKSVIGFVGGIIMTYLCFMFFVFQLSISLIHATIMSSIIGVLLTLGLAFSYRIRCLVFLLIPQFFSRVGRYTLTCYALVLILTGPATNTLKNSEILSESLACGEEQIKTDVRHINESMKKPFNSMKESIRLMVESVKQLAQKIKLILLRLHRLVTSIASSLQSSFSWLSSAADTCNRRLGTPYQRCSEAIKNSVAECQVTLGPQLALLCDAVKITQIACLPMLPLKAFCHALEFVNGNVFGAVTTKLNTFTERINSMLYVEVHIHHSYSFSSNSSRSASQIAAGIVTEIRNKADLLLTWLSWSSCVTSLSLLLIIFRAKYYQHMFETRSRFDNRYVTKELRDLDLKRLRQGKDTVLPLNRREEGKYIKTTSFRLVSSEKVHISRSAVNMAITTFKLMIHMVADYSLYWVLMTIRYHGIVQTPLQPGTPNAGAYVSGSGLISKILQSLLGSISLPLSAEPPSPITCLPNPYPPDYQRYAQIGILIFLLWFFAIFEPYGLRLRHIIMGHYRPERAKARAVWLYNHIQRTRGCFLKFARRKLHREYKYSSEEKFTFRRWLDSKIPCSWLKNLLGVNVDDPHCFLCGVIENCNECDGTLVRCQTPGCSGTFCLKCFSDLGQLCTICLTPADYGDWSDVSFEKGSSEESDSEDELPANPDARPYASCNITIEEDVENTKYDKKARNELGWFFGYKQQGLGNQDYIPLLSNIKGCNDNEEISLTLPKDNSLSKAMVIRHKKYTDFDSGNGRKLEIISLGQDTECAVCYKYCKQCSIKVKEPVYIFNSELQQSTNKTSKKYNTESFTRSAKDTSIKRSTTNYENNVKINRSNLSVNESLVRLIERFKKIRKKALNARRSNRNIKNIKNRSLIDNITAILKKRKSSLRRRRKKIKRFSKHSTTFSNNPSFNSKSSRNYRRCSKQSRFVNNSRNFLIKMLKFGHKLTQIISSDKRNRTTHVNYDKNSKYKQDTFQLLQNDVISQSHILKGAENFIASASRSEFAVPNKNVTDNEECPNDHKQIEGDKLIKYVPSQDSCRGLGRVCKICSEFWKTRRTFSPCTLIVAFFKRDEVPIAHVKTNHKRRKKNQFVNDFKLENRKNRKDNEATRKYRISSYLSEQEWIKRRYKDFKSKSNMNVGKEIIKELYERDEATKLFIKTSNEDDEDEKQKLKRALEEIRNILPDINEEYTLEGRQNYEDSSSSLFSSANNKGVGANLLSSSENKCGIAGSDSLNTRLLTSVDFDRSDENRDSNTDNLGNDVVGNKGKDNNQTKSSNNAAKIKRNMRADKSGGSVKNSTHVEAPTNNEQVSAEPKKSSNKKKKNPFCLMISWCFANPKKKKKKPTLKQADAEVVVSPVVEARSCQYMVLPSTEEHSPQVNKLKDAAQSISLQLCRDVEIDAARETCTCATQYLTPSKNVSNHRKTKLKPITVGVTQKDASTSHYSALKNDTHRDIGTIHKQTLTQNFGVQCQINPKPRPTAAKGECVKMDSTSKYPKTLTPRPAAALLKQICDINRYAKKEAAEKSSSSVEHLSSLSSINSDEDGTRTDTTVCSMAQVQYAAQTPPRRGTMAKRLKVSVVTKANRATETESKKLCDVSTVTSDWWSPILERKNKGLKLSKKDGSPVIVKESQPSQNTRKNKSVATEGRVVTFKSHPQIIPSRLKLSKEDAGPVIVKESQPSQKTRKNKSVATKGIVVSFKNHPRIIPSGFKLSKKDGCPVIVKESQPSQNTRKNKSVATKGIVVSLKSHPQIIPSGFKLSKKDGCPVVIIKERQPSQKTRKNKSVATKERVVSFKSHPQIIPSVFGSNIMSPSRYLLESQKYYNELFINNVSSVEVVEGDNMFLPKHRNDSKNKKNKRGKESKRLEEIYTSRPRGVLNPYMEQVWTAESDNQQRSSSSNTIKKHRSGVKKRQNNVAKKSWQHHRYQLEKPELKVKKGVVNLLTRRYLSNDEISLDWRDSFATTGSY